MKKLWIALALLAFGATAHAAPTCVIGTPGAAPVMTLTFTPPTTNSDGTPLTLPLTYTVFQGTTSGGEVQVASGINTTPIVVNTGLTIGTTAYVYIKAVDSNGASVPTAEVCKTFPASTSPPSPPTNLVAS